MKTADQWFEEYGISHKNKTNKFIHWVCVPAIFFSIIGLFAAIPHDFLDALFPENYSPYVNFGSIALVIALMFYFALSPRLFIGMLFLAIAIIYGNAMIETSTLSLWQFSLTVFVLAWVGQFIGHHIEGAKPSFFKDLQFLMIGPAWLMHFIYKKLGLKY
tara:strand:+ start:14055 stop:14534 length:480 start_codon:yes stop_codon:yes gene_type:complete